jgi:phosphopantetheine adenylyltransferase
VCACAAQPVELHDMAGPAASDAALAAIVLSPETASSADAINTTRTAHGLAPLKAVVIDFVEGYACAARHDRVLSCLW